MFSCMEQISLQCMWAYVGMIALEGRSICAMVICETCPSISKRGPGSLVSQAQSTKTTSLPCAC